MDNTHLASLATFRATAYAACGRRRDALFELCDTLLTTGPVPSLPFLAIQPQHQRKWGSLYDALAVGQIDRPALEHLLASHPLAGGEPVSAGDASGWPRGQAQTRPERPLSYHASRHAAGPPTFANFAASWDSPPGLSPARRARPPPRAP